MIRVIWGFFTIRLQFLISKHFLLTCHSFMKKCLKDIVRCPVGNNDKNTCALALYQNKVAATVMIFSYLETETFFLTKISWFRFCFHSNSTLTATATANKWSTSFVVLSHCTVAIRFAYHKRVSKPLEAVLWSLIAFNTVMMNCC